MANSIPKETIALALEVEAFEQDSTKITEETVSMLQKYMEVFVREAVMRSSVNKEQVKREQGALQAQEPASGVTLTHEDLENITGLLLLDM